MYPIQKLLTGGCGRAVMSHLQDLTGGQFLQQFPLFLLRQIPGKESPDSCPFPAKYQGSRIWLRNRFFVSRIDYRSFCISQF